MAAALRLGQITGRTIADIRIGLSQDFQRAIVRTQANRAVSLTGEDFVVVFEIGVRTVFEDLGKAHGADGNVRFLIASGAEKHETRGGNGSCNRATQKRSKAIIKPIAWTEGNVCLEQVGAANEGIEREHAAVRMS